MYKNKKNRIIRKGFTLIELMISIVLFVMFLGIVSQAYLGIVRTQRHANEVRKMYSDVRVAMDFMAEEIRLSAIDYDCYEGITADVLTLPPCGGVFTGQTLSNGSADILALIKKGGQEKTFIRWDHEKGKLQAQKYIKSNNVWAPAPGYEQYKDLLSDKLTVGNLKFMIFPDVNPYSEDWYYTNSVQFQPKVTIFLSVENTEGVDTDFKYDFQTTISSRIYSRKI